MTKTWFTNVTKFVIFYNGLLLPRSEYQEDSKYRLHWIWGLGSLRQKQRKEQNLSSGVFQWSIFGHDLKTLNVLNVLHNWHDMHIGQYYRWKLAKTYNSQCNRPFNIYCWHVEGIPHNQQNWMSNFHRQFSYCAWTIIGCCLSFSWKNVTFQKGNTTSKTNCFKVKRNKTKNSE